jgi:hypothetical protein
VNSYAEASTFRFGSREHRQLLVDFFLESSVQYVPEMIRWPDLPEPDRARLAGMPFWQEAVATENRASNTVTAAAAIEPDPDIRRAIEMQAFEEHRHARLLVALTRRYSIEVSMPARFVPSNVQNDFLSAGFGECFDSFFAFGLFALARRSGFFNEELVSIFEPVMQEEVRHILFFVNWLRYHRQQLPWWKRPAFRLRCGMIILKHVFSRIKTARQIGSGADADNFTLSARHDIGAPVTLQTLLALCLTENDRRMARYDSRLLRPRLVPYLAKFVTRVLPAGI